MGAQRGALRRSLRPACAALAGSRPRLTTGRPSADLVKQRNLPFGGALPVKALGVGPGGGPRGRGREQVAGRSGEPIRRGLTQDAARLGRPDDIGNPVDVGDKCRRPARHALQQHIGPTFRGRNQHKKIGRAIDLGKVLLRHEGREVVLG